MKKYSLAILFILCCYFSFGQAGNITPNFLKTKLLVILGEYSEFDNSIKKAFNKHWDINEYIFIDHSEIEKYKDSAGYSFFRIDKIDISSVYRMDVQTHHIDRGYDLNYYYFSLSMNIPKKGKTESSNIRIAFNPAIGITDFYEAEAIKTLAIFRDYVKAILEDKITGFTQFDEFINKNFDTGILENKILMIDSSDVYFMKKVNISTCYPYKIQFTSKEKIYEAILNYDPNVVYFSQTMAAISYNYLIDASNSKLIYLEYHSGFKVNCSFLKRISKK